MSDTFVTFHGWVGNDVVYRSPQGLSVVNFRVASTPRIKRDGKWMDGDTTWYSVSAWRNLAENIRDSIRKGDAVIVHGRLRSEHWTREDKQVSTTLLVEASFVGHDLIRGTSRFSRSVKQERSDPSVDEEVQQMAHREPEDLTPFDSFGNPKVPEDAPEDAPADAPEPGEPVDDPYAA
jgi:single-strand DNA-binding protein